MINNLYYGSDNADIDRFRNASFTFDTDVLATFLRRIYNGFDTSNDVEPTMWREILRIINEATVDGLVQGNFDTNIDKTFLEKLAHSNEVFSAFKVHNMGVDMAKKMRTDEGKLKPFSEWKKDIKSIASHYCGAWLQTEYNTATLRAKFAAEWKQYEADADIMPNLRWMPTTSANPEEEHKVYWMNRLTLPVGDKFWDKHHPGDHWNCKCSLEQTDDLANPDVLSHIPDVKAQKGLAANPGKTGEMFDRNHPYYERKCSKCWVKKNKSFKDAFTPLGNCNKCPFMDNCTEKIKAEEPQPIPPTKEEFRAYFKSYAQAHMDKYNGEVIVDNNFATGSLTVLKRSLDDMYSHCKNPKFLNWLASYSSNKIKDWELLGWLECQPYPPEHPKYDPQNPDKKKHSEAEYFYYYMVDIGGEKFCASVKMHRTQQREVLYTITENLDYNIHPGKHP